jgi:hypothetical protein
MSENIKFGDLVSREERHYCAFLFAWFLMDKKNIQTYFKQHTKRVFENIDTIDYQNCEIFYEFTAIRELIHFEQHVHKDSITAAEIKTEAEKDIFNEKRGDIQKKKADFAFYFKTEKILVLTEAKFEMDYDKDQFKETFKYGEYLMNKFDDDIKAVQLTLLGLDYYNAKKPTMKEDDSEIEKELPSISWEKIVDIIDNKNIKNEIIKGLDYQKRIHKVAMKNWEKRKY